MEFLQKGPVTPYKKNKAQWKYLFLLSKNRFRIWFQFSYNFLWPVSASIRDFYFVGFTLSVLIHLPQFTVTVCRPYVRFKLFISFGARHVCKALVSMKLRHCCRRMDVVLNNVPVCSTSIFVVVWEKASKSIAKVLKKGMRSIGRKPSSAHEFACIGHHQKILGMGGKTESEEKRTVEPSATHR